MNPTHSIRRRLLGLVTFSWALAGALCMMVGIRFGISNPVMVGLFLTTVTISTGTLILVSLQIIRRSMPRDDSAVPGGQCADELHFGGKISLLKMLVASNFLPLCLVTRGRTAAVFAILSGATLCLALLDARRKLLVFADHVVYQPAIGRRVTVVVANVASARQAVVMSTFLLRPTTIAAMVIELVGGTAVTVPLNFMPVRGAAPEDAMRKLLGPKVKADGPDAAERPLSGLQK